MQLKQLNKLSLGILVDQVCNFLNQFKDVPGSTNDYLKQNIQKRYGFINSEDVMKAVTAGVGGEYGEFRSVDPQTIFKWLGKYASEMDKGDNYLEQPLLDASIKYFKIAYSNEDWRKEANKCYLAFKGGVNPRSFSEGVYQRMMLDNLLPFPSVESIEDSISRYFNSCINSGRSIIYTISEKE